MAVLNATSLTPAQIAANQVRSIVQQQYASLARAGTQGFNLIWKNPTVKPADIIAAFGTDAAAIFQLANLNITTVQSAATLGGATAPVIPSVPSQYVLTFNSDGSATVTNAGTSGTSGFSGVSGV